MFLTLPSSFLDRVRVSINSQYQQSMNEMKRKWMKTISWTFLRGNLPRCDLWKPFQHNFRRFDYGALQIHRHYWIVKHLGILNLMYPRRERLQLLRNSPKAIRRFYSGNSTLPGFILLQSFSNPLSIWGIGPRGVIAFGLTPG